MIELTNNATTGFVTMKMPVEIIDYIDRVTSSRLESRASWIRAAIIARLDREGVIRRPARPAEVA